MPIIGADFSGEPPRPPKTLVGVDAPLDGLNDKLAKTSAESLKLEKSMVAVYAITRVLNTALHAFHGLLGLIKTTVAAFNPAVMMRFNYALMSLKATIGDILEPIVIKATAVIKELAYKIYNLSPATKVLLLDLARLGIVLGIIASILAPIIALGAAIAALVAALGGWLTLILALAVVAAIPFIAAAAALAYLIYEMGGFETYANLLAGFWVTVKAIISAAVDTLDGAFDDLIEAFHELWDAVKPLVHIFVVGFAIALATGIKIIVYFIAAWTKFMAIIATGAAKLLNLVGGFVGLTDVFGGIFEGKGGGKTPPSGIHTAEIGTDIAGLKTRLEEKMLRLQPGATPVDYQKQAADTLKNIYDLLKNRIGQAVNQAQAGAGAAVGGFFGGMGLPGIGQAIAGLVQ